MCMALLRGFNFEHSTPPFFVTEIGLWEVLPQGMVLKTNKMLFSNNIEIVL